ncbi:hypothetical protein [uncultured Aquimarina sp.]|uniref:hypothetical protein n=1 Tax=uncultured Aquimarina sp. TaxID=575652 RepID=UPI00260DE329|nr:hypothetical protein [uncultured Aquimarina sp.]
MKFITGSVRVRCGCKKSITSWIGDYPDRASLNRAVARNCPHGAFCHTNPEFEDGGMS